MQHLIKILIILGLFFVRQHIDEWFDLPPEAHKFLQFVLKLLWFFLILNLLYSIGLLYYRRTRKLSATHKDRITAAMRNLYLLLFIITGFFIVLDFFGLDYKTLFTSLSIVAAAIAIVFKDYISPIIGGFAIVFSKEINIDDYVQIGNHKGKVTQMSLSKLSLLNEDDDLISLPNDKVYQSEIVNFTQGNYRKVSIPFEIDATFKGSIEDLEKNLIKVLKEYHTLIEKNSFHLRIVDIHRDRLNLKFQYVLNKVDRDVEREIRKKTVRQVVNYLRLERKTEEAKNVSS